MLRCMSPEVALLESLRSAQATSAYWDNGRMRRRSFIAGLGSAAAWSIGARAQRAGVVHRIGFLGSATSAGSAKAVESFRTGLCEFGYVEGTNIGIEFRWAEGNYDRLPRLVAELIGMNVDVLVTHGTPAALQAKQATATIPIVMAIIGDAVANGLVASLARPEANITGSTYFLPQLNAKRLELLKEACPHAFRPAAPLKPRQSCQHTEHSSDASSRFVAEFGSRTLHHIRFNGTELADCQLRSRHPIFGLLHPVCSAQRPKQDIAPSMSYDPEIATCASRRTPRRWGATAKEASAQQSDNSRSSTYTYS